MTRDSEFHEHAVRVSEATATAVRDAFAALPRRGCLEAVCRWEKRLEVLAALEESGAFAICLEPVDGFDVVRIVVLKGKSGPCYDTGRSAVYLGEAAAVLDDDRHLIVGTIRVCEKTGGLYTLWPYHDVLSVTEADEGLLARLDRDPVPFDCNTFDVDSRRLVENVERRTPDTQRSTDDVAVVYPGPFRALVLKDGTVVRRGVATLVSASQAAQNGLLRLPSGRAREARPCERYAEARGARGTAFILEALPSGGGFGETTRPFRGGARSPSAPLESRALAALRAAPRDFKQRLLQLIDAREPYWVLTGSDPDVAGGCCPSTQVGVANRLVREGALQAYAPLAPSDACTATFYAFPGEIEIRRSEVGSQRSEDGTSGEPGFCILENIRQQAAAALRDDRWGGAKRAVRMGLLTLLGVALGLSAWRTLERVQVARDSRLCAVCAVAERLTLRAVGHVPLNAAGAVSLGALSAVQPCALAVLAGAVAAAWKPGAGRWTGLARASALAAGTGVSNVALAVAVAWGLSRAVGGMADGVQAFRGPLMILAGLPLTGLFRISVRQMSGVTQGGSIPGLFLLGAAVGVLWCPMNTGLFAGALLPSALRHGEPVRDALLYGAGYTVPLFVLCAILAAGVHLAILRSVSRFSSVTAGWCLILGGALSAIA